MSATSTSHLTTSRVIVRDEIDAMEFLINPQYTTPILGVSNLFLQAVEVFLNVPLLKLP